MISKLELENFTVFGEKVIIDFSPKINLIIGENGTGKTHLLKAAYAMCSAPSRLVSDAAESTDDDISKVLTDAFAQVFQLMENRISKLRRTGGDGQAELKATFSDDQSFKGSFYTNSQNIKVVNQSNYASYRLEPVYIPTKEVLSMMEGFVSLYDKYQLSFDRTYRDLCSRLDLPKMRMENLSEKSKWAMEEIETIVGGKFVFHGGGRVTFRSANEEYSINVMAEGFRKAGVLSRLLETGVVQPGVNGTLFWDEPESNMNPKLMQKLVEILLELSRNGQQIVIATHDYILLKWFDLLQMKERNDVIKYHSLFRENDTVKVKSVDQYRLVNQDPISEAYSHIYDAELKRAMGVV